MGYIVLALTYGKGGLASLAVDRRLVLEGFRVSGLGWRRSDLAPGYTLDKMVPGFSHQQYKP